MHPLHPCVLDEDEVMEDDECLRFRSSEHSHSQTFLFFCFSVETIVSQIREWPDRIFYAGDCCFVHDRPGEVLAV